MAESIRDLRLTHAVLSAVFGELGPDAAEKPNPTTLAAMQELDAGGGETSDGLKPGSADGPEGWDWKPTTGWRGRWRELNGRAPV